MSYFRDVERPKRTQDDSDEDATEEDSEEDSRGRSKRQMRNVRPRLNGVASGSRQDHSGGPLTVETVEGLVFGNKPWLSLPNNPPTSSVRDYPRESKPKRFFFKREPLDGSGNTSLDQELDDSRDDDMDDVESSEGEDEQDAASVDETEDNVSTNDQDVFSATRAWRDVAEAAIRA